MSDIVTTATADAPLGAPLGEQAEAAAPAGAEAPADAAETVAENVIPVTRGEAGNFFVTDASGRKLVVKKLSQIERARMLEAAEDVSSFRWIGMATIALSVRSVNGVPQVFPSNKKQIENRFEQLGDDGMDAAQNVMFLAGESKVLNRYEMAEENPVIAKN